MNRTAVGLSRSSTPQRFNAVRELGNGRAKPVRERRRPHGSVFFRSFEPVKDDL